MRRERLESMLERGPEAGNTLVIALLVLFLLTSLGVSYVAVTKGEKQIAGNQVAGSQAFENAEAGISEVLTRMSNPNSADFIGQLPPGTYTPGWGRYVVNDPGGSANDPQYNATTSDGLDNNGNAAVDEASEHYPETGSRQLISPNLTVATRLDYPWVKVRYKLNGANQILLFGDHDNNPLTPPRENLVRGIPEIIVTAAGRKGVGNKIVTVEAVKWPLPPVPGSVYTEGAMTFQGNAFDIDGHDHNYTAPYDTIAGAPPLPGISTPNDPNAISSNLNAVQQDNVTGTGSDPSVQPSIVNLDLQAMAQAWSDAADITLVGNQSNPSTAGWGDVNNLKIIHVAGDLHLSSNTSGAGVLVIDGDFTLSGSFNWSGVVLCLGDVTITGGGIAKQIVGALMVQGTLSGSTAMNGNISCFYSSAMIAKLNALSRYEVSSWIDQ
ncbi:MAG: PilX N-terminal domain-containing pilus assembly protein [Hyphomicrobiales bacterium]